MKTLVVLATQLVAFSVLASPVINVKCVSPAGAPQKVVLTESSDPSKDWPTTAVLLINGHRGESSDQVSSNDGQGDLTIENNGAKISGYAQLTSDEGNDVDLTFESVQVALTPGSTQDNGSAHFPAHFKGSVTRGGKREYKSEQVLSCKADWSTK